MTEDATDPTGERLRDPEGPDTPNRNLPPDIEKEEQEPRSGPTASVVQRDAEGSTAS